VKRRASVLDKHFKVCGARFGLTFIIGTLPIPPLTLIPVRARTLTDSCRVCYALALVPVAGDALTPMLGYIFVVHQARKAKCVFPSFSSSPHLITIDHCLLFPPSLPQCRIPRALTRRMILNLAISTTIGIMPGLGAILVAAYRANVRNARLLENFLAARGERAGKAAQSAATSEETRRGTTEEKDRDRDRDDNVRQGKAREMTEEKPGAARSTPDGEKEKGKSKITEGDEKDKNTTAAVPDPDNGANEGQRTYLRPTRNTLEFVHNRDSRFIEDVT
jgi:Domain of unknown function (DUF4112)